MVNKRCFYVRSSPPGGRGGSSPPPSFVRDRKNEHEGSCFFLPPEESVRLSSLKKPPKGALSGGETPLCFHKNFFARTGPFFSKTRFFFYKVGGGCSHRGLRGFFSLTGENTPLGGGLPAKKFSTPL